MRIQFHLLPSWRKQIPTQNKFKNRCPNQCFTERYFNLVLIGWLVDRDQTIIRVLKALALILSMSNINVILSLMITHEMYYLIYKGYVRSTQ
jgi:hypothetical protein